MISIAILEYIPECFVIAMIWDACFLTSQQNHHPNLAYQRSSGSSELTHPEPATQTHRFMAGP